MGNVRFLCQDGGSLCTETGLFLPTRGSLRRVGVRSSHRADKRGFCVERMIRIFTRVLAKLNRLILSRTGKCSMIRSAKSPREDAFRDIAKPGHIIAPSPRAIDALLTLVLSSVFSFS